MPKVKAYFKKDGTRVRSHWRKAPKAGRGAVVAVVVGIAAATMTGSEGGYAAPKAGARSRARPSNGAIPAAVQADFKKAQTALVASGYKTRLAVRFDADCEARSYGQVHEFFKSHPCKWMARAYVQIGDSEVLVAISWVEMPSASLAQSYKQLIDTPGAGNVTELSRETTLYRKIGYEGGPHVSGMNGVPVWNVQVKPVFPKSTAEITKILLDSRQ